MVNDRETSDALGNGLLPLIEKARRLLGTVDSRMEGRSVLSVEDLLRGAIGNDLDVSRLRQLGFLLGELSKLHSAASDTGGSEDGRFHVSLETPFDVRLSLIPARAGGKPVALREVISRLKDLGVVHGVSKEALQGAWEATAQRRETIWRLLVAAGVPALSGEDASISFAVKAFDKRVLLDPNQPFFGDLAAMIEEVKAGALVAKITPASPGQPGRDVHGGAVEAAPGRPLGLAVGEGLQLLGDGRELHALVPGSLVVGEDSLDLVPFHLVDGQVGVGQDISFDGNVLVTGHVTGPVRIHARDVYIAGNAETVSVSASGDLWVGGAIQGKATVEAEGRVFARSISDATVRAIGDVFVQQSIVESRVTSGGEVMLNAARGTIEGGEVSAFRRIGAHTLGSSFGLPTRVRVGSADLRGPLWTELDKKIRENEEAVSKIDDVKGELVKPKASSAQLPPDRMGIYISLLRKEVQILDELRALRRRRKKLDARAGEGGVPSLSVAGPIHPPVTIEIGETSEEILEPLSGVLILRGPERRLAIQKQEVRAGHGGRKS